jgi:hypothetical protein
MNGESPHADAVNGSRDGPAGPSPVPGPPRMRQVLDAIPPASGAIVTASRWSPPRSSGPGSATTYAAGLPSSRSACTPPAASPPVRSPASPGSPASARSGRGSRSPAGCSHSPGCSVAAGRYCVVSTARPPSRPVPVPADQAAHHRAAAGHDDPHHAAGPARPALAPGVRGDLSGGSSFQLVSPGVGY